ncbi:MAG: hypothetical protein P1V97_05220 [Planctomycetota bacterium]|nr:hypothetical protein [Planctomycetota bacterium]
MASSPLARLCIVRADPHLRQFHMDVQVPLRSLKAAFLFTMDNSLTELQRRFYLDPSNKQALNTLVRGLAAIGKTGEGYNLLFDHGSVDKKEPLALELGARLAESEESVRSQKLGQASQFALNWEPHGTTRQWTYLYLHGVRYKKNPVLAITHNGRKGTAKTLLKNLSAFPALRTLFLDHSRNFKTKDLLSIPQLPSLRHLFLKSINVSDPTDSNRREGFKHLCTIAPLRTLKIQHSKLPRQLYELCTLCPTLQALDLSDSKELGSLDFLTKLPRLEFLSLSSNDIDLGVFPKGLEQLRALDLSHVTYTGEQLEKLELPKLEILYLASAQLTSQHLRVLPKFTRLKTLELNYNPELKSDDLKPLAQLPNLETLTFRYCRRLGKQALELLKDFPALKTLDVRGAMVLNTARERLRDHPQIQLETAPTNSFHDHWRLRHPIWGQCMGRP